MYENPLNEYALILESNMKKFGLESLDIAFLSGVNKKTIDAVLNRTGGIELKSLESISCIFGLRYFQFGNPDFDISQFDSLPEETKVRIAFRKADGQHINTDYDHPLLNEKIKIILTNYNIGDEFLSEDIVREMLKVFKEKVSTSKVTKRLVNSLSEYALQTKKTYKVKGKKGRKPMYYKLIKEIPYQILMDAKEKVGK